MSQIRILFVDDEEKALAGLRRMLHSQRDQWDMHFANSSERALELLEHESFSVVVSDMRMPGMNGTELLREVKKRSPHTVRIILSGHSETQTFVESSGIAHQTLTKPCDSETVKNTVARACSLRNLLSDEVLRDLVSQVGSLRFKSSHFIQVMQELRAEDVTSISPNTAKGLALSVKIFSQVPIDPVPGFSMDQLWEHSVRVASCAQAIASSESKSKSLANEAFLGGLLHDVGKLFLAANLPDRYEEVHKLARTEGIEIPQAESRLLHATHAEVGGYLLGLWGLTHAVVEAVAFHHQPSRSVLREFTPLTAVHVANALCRPMNSDCLSLASQDDSTTNMIDTHYVAELRLEGRIAKWRELCLETQGEPR